MGKKKNIQTEKKTEVREPKPSYETSLGENNHITITTFEELEQMDIESARNRTYLERMEYLHKLIRVIHGEDFSAGEKAFYTGKISIRKME